MGRIVSNFFISLDGVVEAPNEWHFPYFDDAMGAVIGSGMADQGAFLLGRRLYDEWSQYWPGNTEHPFGEHINAIRKYVVSDTLTEADWQNTVVVPGDGAAERIRAIKDETDGDIAMSGSATTVRWLLEEGLLDELALLLHPIVVGKGARLFDEGSTHPLELVHQSTLPTGVLHLRYRPVPA